MAPCEPRDVGESGELLNKFSGYRWPGNNHIPRPILGVSAAAEEPLPRVHVAFVGDGGDDASAGSEEFFDFGVGHLGEVVDDLVVVLLLHDACLSWLVPLSDLIFFSSSVVLPAR